MPVPTLPVDPIPSEDPKNKKSEEEKKEDTKLKGKGKENANDKEGEEELVSFCFRGSSKMEIK